MIHKVLYRVRNTKHEIVKNICARNRDFVQNGDFVHNRDFSCEKKEYFFGKRNIFLEKGIIFCENIQKSDIRTQKLYFIISYNL